MTTPTSFQCRICLQDDDKANLISPCKCTGSMAYIHFKCLKTQCQSSRGNPEICPTCLGEFSGVIVLDNRRESVSIDWQRNFELPRQFHGWNPPLIAGDPVDDVLRAIRAREERPPGVLVANWEPIPRRNWIPRHDHPWRTSVLVNSLITILFLGIGYIMGFSFVTNLIINTFLWVCTVEDGQVLTTDVVIGCFFGILWILVFTAPLLTKFFCYYQWQPVESDWKSVTGFMECMCAEIDIVEIHALGRWMVTVGWPWYLPCRAH